MTSVTKNGELLSSPENIRFEDYDEWFCEEGEECETDTDHNESDFC